MLHSSGSNQCEASFASWEQACFPTMKQAIFLLSHCIALRARLCLADMGTMRACTGPGESTMGLTTATMQEPATSERPQPGVHHCHFCHGTYLRVVCCYQVTHSYRRCAAGCISFTLADFPLLVSDLGGLLHAQMLLNGTVHDELCRLGPSKTDPQRCPRATTHLEA
jgi:hypothetical protein